MSFRVLVIHGPNLNMLGKREPDIYGHQTLNDINHMLINHAKDYQLQLDCFQSNHEGEIVDQIQQAFNHYHFIIINPAAFTHTSVAIRDALTGINVPFIEVHLSNIHAREQFRHRSFLSDKALGVICGLGANGYRFALDHAVSYLSHSFS